MKQLRAARKRERAAAKSQAKNLEAKAYCQNPTVAKEGRVLWQKVRQLLTGKPKAIDDNHVIRVSSYRTDVAERFR